MGAPSRRLVLAAALTAVVVLPCSVVRAHAAVCGDDGTPPCPLGQTVTPNVVNAPVRDATVEVHGSGLALVVSARLQPGGATTAIIGRSDTSLTLRLPGGLGAGSYQVELAIAGQTQGFSTTPFFQVADPSAARGLPQFTFAPAPPAGQASATSVPTLAPFGATGSGSSSWASIVRITLVVLAAGAIGGGLVTVLYLIMRQRREIRLHDLTYAAMDRRLEELWSTDERRVGEAAPTAPNPVAAPNQPFDREPSPAHRY
jgi:hypothetical protein